MSAASFDVDEYVEDRSARIGFTRPAVEPATERSGRAVNAMDPDTRLIHARLDEWAKEVKRSAGARGYPSESAYVAWSVLQVRTESGHEPDLSERAQHVEAAVLRLGAIDQSVIRRYYLDWRQTGIHKGLAGINNEDKFRSVLKRARFRVDGYLSAIEQP